MLRDGGNHCHVGGDRIEPLRLRSACDVPGTGYRCWRAGSTQQGAIDDLKGKIFDAKMAQKTFERGLKYCGELDGNHFYFLPRDRVLDLEEFHRSLEALAKQQVFNPEKRPWTEQDAAERWAQAQKQAARDKANCALAMSLPELEKQLEELEKKQPAPARKN